jgi:putative ABC transport system substrate-binding protein
MNRRETLAALLALGAAPWGRRAYARAVRRIGYLKLGPLSGLETHHHEAFVQGLRESGYVAGGNLAIEYRSAEGDPERLAAAAGELVRAKVALIVTDINLETRAARQAAGNLPIVMVVGTDVVAEGFVASLARPGGNITGLTWDVGIEVITKRFELMKEAVPNAKRIAVLWDPERSSPNLRRMIERGGEAVGASLVWTDAGQGLEVAFAKARRGGAQALFTGGARLFPQRRRVVELAARFRLPDAHYDSAFVEAGGLMSYAPNLFSMYRRAATYVSRILEGAKPADLPVEQPMKVELALNLKTARALGLVLPQSLLIRADRVIE